MYVCIVQSFPVAPKMCGPWEQVGRAECGTQCVKSEVYVQPLMPIHPQSNSRQRQTEERGFPGSEVRDYRMNFSLKLPFPSRITIRHIVSTRHGKAPREHRANECKREKERE